LFERTWKRQVWRRTLSLTATDAAKSGDNERLDDLMRKIYFGTALVKEIAFSLAAGWPGWA
jgi:hypothetical protein